MKLLDQTWHPVRQKKRTFSFHHHTNLRDYLILLNSYINHINEGTEKKYVFVFSDESYIHQSHISKYSYITEEGGKWK